MVNSKIHNVRFYKPKSKAIYCMALHERNRKLALSRSNGSIEIWDLQYVPFIERIITSTPDNYSIEGLVWCNDRLFSVGLHGLLVEYDLFSLTKKEIYTITGEAAFCIDANRSNSCLAVGTQQGYLNIFHIEEDGVKFQKFLDKQEGKILCLKYDFSENYIVSGSIDVIRIWNVNTGHALHKMSTGRSEMNKSTIVWCLEITREFVIISGDSRGKLTFWDGKIGSQIESYQSHRADILTLTISEDQNTLYCAGTDPNIVSYAKVQMKDQSHKWVKNIQRTVHDHDVRAMILFNSKLYSGGIDGYLACSYYPPKTLLKYPPLLQSGCVSVRTGARYIVLRYYKHLEIWKLGRTVNSEQYEDFCLLPLTSEPKKLLVLQRTVKDDAGKDKKEGIMCSDVTSDGKWIVFSTDSTLRLFNFICENDDNPKLNLVTSLPPETEVSVNVVFTPDDLELILAVRSGRLVILDLMEISLKQIIETRTLLKDTVTYLKVSGCGNYLVAADCASNIIVWNKVRDQWKYYCKLPKYNCPITALAIQQETQSIMIAYADHKIVEYCLPMRRFSTFSERLNENKVKQWVNKSFPIRDITFDSRNSNVAILHDDSNIVVINKNKQVADSSAKIPKMASEFSPSSNRPQKYAFHRVKKYKHLVHLGWLSADEMVAVEVSPLGLMDQLSPCLTQAPFGTK